ncbi:MAG: twin-arginine translocase TatA/TatE family subunit [Rheinheimera sp.]|nr:twin-arginine translocase TatA/TatE family subunit [Gammaproteobacteria bacterium]MDZ7902973.1 twin-arginine translocase TatA/TatE family subunit [Rheinheimera sp.]
MGIGGISIWQLLIILAIVVVLFGTKRLRNIGDDLGSALRSFRSSLKGPEPEATEDATFEQPQVTAQPAPVQTAAQPAAQPAAAQPAATATEVKPTTQDKI